MEEKITIESMQHAASFWAALDWMLNHLEVPDNKMYKENFKRIRRITTHNIKLLNNEFDKSNKHS